MSTYSWSIYLSSSLASTQHGSRMISRMISGRLWLHGWLLTCWWWVFIYLSFILLTSCKIIYENYVFSTFVFNQVVYHKFVHIWSGLPSYTAEDSEDSWSKFSFITKLICFRQVQLMQFWAGIKCWAGISCSAGCGMQDALDDEQIDEVILVSYY